MTPGKVASVAGPFHDRESAREAERRLTQMLDGARLRAASTGGEPLSQFLGDRDLPLWTQGFRVAKIGKRTLRHPRRRWFHVEATSTRGH